MNLDITLEKYLQDLSSSEPTPGGGNAAALSGVIASSLGEMVCNLTIGKKKYLEFEEEFKELRLKFIDIKNALVDLAGKDNEAFESVMDAFKMPKETDAQKEDRNKEIEDRTYFAAVIPSQVVAECHKLLPLLKTAVEKGNTNCLSDAGVGVSMTLTAAQGALYNVQINCASLNDKEKAEGLLNNTKDLFNEIKKDCEDLLSSIDNRLK